MQKYKIGAGIRDNVLKVELNDDGDFIIINPSDSRFAEKYGDFLRWLDTKNDDLTKIAQEAEERYKGRPIISQDEEGNAQIDTEQFQELAALQRQVYQECTEKIDAIFGQDTFKKYFKDFYEINPDFVPDEDCINDFIEQMTPAINLAYDTRMKAIGSKYSKNRRGKARKKENE